MLVTAVMIVLGSVISYLELPHVSTVRLARRAPRLAQSGQAVKTVT